jgi:hypothetical protein
MRGRDIQLPQEQFAPGPPKLDPADILPFKRDDPRVARTLQAGKLSLLVRIDPVYPGGYEGSESFDVEVKGEGVVSQGGWTKSNHHRAGLDAASSRQAPKP